MNVFNSSVFKEGGVTERKVEKPQEISQIKKSGIASLPSSWRGKSLGSQRPSHASQNRDKNEILSNSISESLNPTDTSSNEEMQQISDTNMQQIMQMSPQELQEAERDIASMFSSKNFDFLKKSSLQKFGNVKMTDSKNLDSTRDGKKRYIKNDGLDMVTTVEELKGIQNEATKAQRANFAWAIDDSKETYTNDRIDEIRIDDKQNGSMIDPKKKKPVALKAGNKPVVSSRFLMRSSSDRFDLKGCKVIEKSSTIDDISDALTENVCLKKFNLSKEKIHFIATACVEEMLDIGFAVQHIPLNDSQPQDELLNHENDRKLPGYNLTEICEFYRSENPAQRLLGLRMLQGLLRRRDQAVSLESYTNVNDDRDDVEKQNERGTVDEKFEILQNRIQKILDIMVQNISFSSKSIHLDVSQNANEQIKIRRVLVYLLLIMCASDLPTGLPTLLVWGIKHPRLPPNIALNTLKCLRDYISCGPEECASAILWDGMLGTIGCPSLPMPHARRTEISYEEHIEDCFDNRRSVQEEEQTNIQEEIENKTGGDIEKKASFSESFALRCRWGRVDNFISEGDIIVSLCNYILSGANILKNTHGLNKNGMDSASLLCIQSAFVSLEILHSLCRLCDKDQIHIVVQNIRNIWIPCLIFLEFSESFSSSEQLGYKGSISCGWWKVLSETCRRSRDFALWICHESQSNIISKCLILLLKSPYSAHIVDSVDVDIKTRNRNYQRDCWDPIVWSLRLWRVCLAYGVGLNSVSELLLAAQLNNGSRSSSGRGLGDSGIHNINSSSNISMQVAHSLGPGMTALATSPERLIAIMWLLEQASVSCAVIIDVHTTEVIAKENTEERKTDKKIEKKERKSYEDDDMKTSVLEMIEMEIQEKLAAALECSRLMLSIGEQLFSALISHSAASSSNNEGSSSNIDTTQCVLRSASLHFISSVIGTFHTDHSTDNNNVHNDNDGMSKENSFNTRKEKVNDTSKASLICNVAEICCLRQYSSPWNPHERLNGNSSENNDGGILDVNGDGNSNWDDKRGRSRTGLGLLQSCLEYAQYVRTSTIKLQGEISDEKIVTEQATVLPASTSRNDPIQFAALHHLTAKINQFIATIIQEKSVFNINHLSSERSALSTKISTNNSFLSWILLEEYFSWERLLSNSISYVASRIADRNGNDISSDTDKSSQSRNENILLRSLLLGICSAKQTRMDVTATLIKTSPPVVAQGLYAWQSHRILQLLMLNDLQLLNEGFKVDVVDRTSVISGVLKCMHSMGQGMKGKVVQMALIVISGIFSKINGLSGDNFTSSLVDNSGQSTNTERMENAGTKNKIIQNKIPFIENGHANFIKNETKDQMDLKSEYEMVEYEKIMGLKSEVLNNILGTKDDFNTRLNYSDFAVILESQKKVQITGNISAKHSPVARSLCDWKNDYLDSKLPVKCSWPLDCLGTFSGDQFERWLVILASHESRASSLEIIDQNRGEKMTTSVLSISAVVSNIHKLLKLACPEEGHRWVTLKDIAPVVDEDEEYEELMVIDASPAAVHAYCSLIEVCSQHILDDRNRTHSIDKENEKNLSPNKISHIEQLISVSQGALSSSNGLLRRGGGLGAGGSEESDFGFGTRVELGVMELCGKLLEGITSQHISSGENFEY
jgi:hypothetical protein